MQCRFFLFDRKNERRNPKDRITQPENQSHKQILSPATSAINAGRNFTTPDKL